MFTALREYERSAEGEVILPSAAPAICVGVLAQLDYMFVGRPSAVPGMVIAGGVLSDGTPVSGAGSNRDGALVRLAGEAAEQLGLRQAVAGLPSDGDVPMSDWGGDAAGLLAREVLPLSPAKTEGFSEGLAAHTDFEAAMLHGALELFERDAAVTWWAGGSDGVLLIGGEALVEDALGARPKRQTRVVDVTCDTAVPVVVAVSFDVRGDGFCFGAAAGASLEAAIDGAVRELGAAEFGFVLEQSRELVQSAGTGSVDTLTLEAFEAEMIAQRAPLEAHVLRRKLIAKDAWLHIAQENGIGFVDLGCVGGHFQVIKAVSAALQPGQETHVCPRFRKAMIGKKRRTQGPLY